MFPSPLPPPPSSRATNVSYFQRTITQIGRYKRRGEVKLRGRRWLERKREREKEVSLSLDEETEIIFLEFFLQIYLESREKCLIRT